MGEQVRSGTWVSVFVLLVLKSVSPLEKNKKIGVSWTIRGPQKMIRMPSPVHLSSLSNMDVDHNDTPIDMWTRVSMMTVRSESLPASVTPSDKVALTHKH
jgi:hypothetical protein